MTDRTCTIDGCGRPHFGKGLCQAHYFRLRRTGETGPAEIWDRKRPPCSVEDCDRPSAVKGLCDLHRQRMAARGTTDLVWTHPTGEDNYAWQGDDIGYSQAHCRVRKHRGPASGHACADLCGRQAQQWAYDHADPNERTEAGYAYSPDPSHYRPLCVSCHKLFDLHRDNAA